jgi:lysyl-tRNA synthetase class I
MKRILLLIILLTLTAHSIQSQRVLLDNNGVAIKWTKTTVPSTYFVKANQRETRMEWFAIVNNTSINNITDFTENIQTKTVA